MKSLPEIKADNRKAAKPAPVKVRRTHPRFQTPDADCLVILLREAADVVEAAARLPGAAPALHTAHPRMRTAANRIELASELLGGYRWASAFRSLIGQALDGTLARQEGGQ